MPESRGTLPPAARLLVCHVLSLFLTLGSGLTHGAVTVSGIDGELRDNVLAYLNLENALCSADPARARYRFAGAESAIRSALRPFGYYDPRIEGTLEELAGDCWEARFEVDAGEPVLITELDLAVLGEGETFGPFQSVLAASTLFEGGQLRHDDYEALKSRLLITAREYGFFEASLEANELRVDPAAHSATVRLILDSGPRYRFGELFVDGEVLSRELLLRYVEFEEGAPFEQRDLRKLHNDLVRGDYFSTVDVRTVTREDGVADVVLHLEEGRRVRYGVGVGFGTDTGLIVSGDLVQRRVNRAGHRLEVDAEVSSARQNLTLDYRIPGRRPQNDWYSLYTGVNREDTDAIDSIAWKFGVRENRFHTINWRSTPFAELIVEEFIQDGETSRKFSLVPGWGINYITADAPSRPTRGLRLRLEVAGASREVLSDASFLRFAFNGKTILPFSERGRLLLRGDAGYLVTNDFDRVPPTWRFFAGGDRSVRGYDYQSLGPVDEDGKAIGGTRLLTGTIEGDWRFLDRWSGALFADAGNVGEEDLFDDLPWSLGFGLRWYSPVGPIRADLAFPQTGSTDVRLHISMGPDL